jgi:hypothetical protein
VFFTFCDLFFNDLDRATLSSFVIFDKIEGWLKGNFERDCKCETKLWGITILNVSWKALKMVILHKQFNCISIAKLYISFVSHVGPQQVLIDKTSPLIIPFFSKLLGIDMVSSFKIANFIWMVLFEVCISVETFIRGALMKLETSLEVSKRLQGLKIT